MVSLLPRRYRMQRRRDSTSVMAGRFDPLPERDILTSCLNHIGPYSAIEKPEDDKQRKKIEKRLKDRDRKRKQREEARAADRRLREIALLPAAHANANANAVGSSSQTQPQPTASSSAVRLIRPTIHIPAMQRSFSITPSPPSSPQFIRFSLDSTPGPSMSSSTSRTPSKRPRTPDDYECLSFGPEATPPPRKKRIAVKKGWKGWVEGSPEPSHKLINLDAVPILRERRTRSGKNFDAIGVGKDSWV